MEPIFPPEVLKKILDCFGKEELVKCRLVCQTWNELCVQQFIKSGYTINITHENLGLFLEYRKQPRSNIALPMRLNARFLPYDDVTHLLNVFDTWPIVSINCDENYYTGWKQFLPILAKVAPELQSLELPYGITHVNNAQHMETLDKIKFPKLKKIRICTVIPQYQFYDRLIRRCPALEEIHVMGNIADGLGRGEIRIPFQSLKSFAIMGLILPRFLLNQIQNCSDGVRLEKFQFSLLDSKVQAGQGEALEELLNELAPSLRHFSYCVVNLYPIPLPPVFPILTTLNIQFRVRHDLALEFADMHSQHLNLSPVIFPALTTLGIQVLPNWAPDPHPQLHLTTVRNINFEITQSKEWNTELIRDAFSRVLNKCPNATRLTVDGNVFSKLLHSPATDGIQELIARNYKEDYIGKALLGMSHTFKLEKDTDRSGTQGPDLFLGDERLMKSVCKLRLINEKSSAEYPLKFFEMDFNVGAPDEKNILHLEAIDKYFPNLRCLEVSPRMLGSDYQSSNFVAKQIEYKYTKWIVNFYKIVLNN